jgi:vancomycin permeability regulator SanA
LIYFLLRLALFCLIIVILIGVSVLAISFAMADVTEESISDISDISGNYDCILVLGAGLQSDGSPSHMLEDRLKTAIEAFNKIDADVMLMSGDRSGDTYDEPAAMVKYATENGISPDDIIVDNEGFSTYESIIRAKEVYGFDRIIVVTQEYHLHRALYIADKNGVEAVGVSADLRTYRGQFVRDVREILARAKDFFQCK